MFISIVLSFIWFLSLVLSQRSSPVCICHLVIPFSSPTLFSSISVLHTSQAHWRMFGCAGIVVLDSFWCAWGFVLGPALHLSLGMVASAVHQTVEVASDVFHPNPLSHFCKWGNVVPIHISLALLWLNWGLMGLILGFNLYCSWLGICSEVGGRGYWPVLPYFKEIAGHLSSSGPWSTYTNGGIF